MVLRVTLSRPEALNALNTDILHRLHTIFGASPDTSLRLIVLCGTGGRAFAAGADITEMADKSETDIREYVALGQSVMERIQLYPVPVLAAVQGFALGGGLELALACDFILATEASKLGQPEVNLGIIPGFGGTQRLLSRVSLATARRLVMTGLPLSGKEAFAAGLTDFLCSGDDFPSRLSEVEALLVSKAPLALRSLKRLYNGVQGDTLRQNLNREAQEFIELFETDDRREGMKAFVEKRSAQFAGK
jgi:enoyl-CoA hydratase